MGILQEMGFAVDRVRDFTSRIPSEYERDIIANSILINEEVRRAARTQRSERLNALMEERNEIFMNTLPIYHILPESYPAIQNSLSYAERHKRRIILGLTFVTVSGVSCCGLLFITGYFR